MIESDRRKAAFLTTALAALDLDGCAWPSRIEKLRLAPSSCITARALAPLAELVALARPMLEADGACLFLKGPSAAVEVAEARASAVFEAEIFPTASPRSNLVRITKLG